MKNLILFLILFIPFSIIAQSEKSSSALVNDQTDKWMTTISTNSEMRGRMLDMMIVETMDNEEEMQKLVNSLLADPEMNKMITRTKTKRANNETIYIEHRGIVSDSIKVGKMYQTIPTPKK
jgi:hypothetical protein